MIKRTFAAVLLLAIVVTSKAETLFCYGAWTTTKAPSYATKDAGEFTVRIFDYPGTGTGTCEVVIRAAEQEGTNIVTHTFPGTWSINKRIEVAFTASGNTSTFTGTIGAFNQKVKGRWSAPSYAGKIQAVLQH